MAEPPARRPQPRDDREVEYLICRQCNTPCYVFDIVDSQVMEAQCLVCGNDAINEFSLGEDAGSEE